MREQRAAGPGAPAGQPHPAQTDDVVGVPGALADLRLVLPAVAAWLVAWQARLLPVRPVLATAALALLVAAVLLLRSRRSGSALVAAVLVCAAAAGVATAGRVQARAEGPVEDLAMRTASVTVEGVVTDDPRRARATGPGGVPLVVVRLRAELVQLGRGAPGAAPSGGPADGRAGAPAGGDGPVRLRTPVLVLSSDASWLPLLPSQRVRVQGRLRPAERGDDVAAVLSGRGPPTVLTAPSRVQRVAGHLRAGLQRAVEPLPDAEAGLVPGLVVGDTSRLLPEVRDDFAVVGLTHLTAVSGTNVAIVLAAVLALGRRAGLGLRAAPVLAGLGLVAFVVLARPSPSVLRAAAMGVVGLLALATGGRRRALPALAAAVLVLVLVSPDLAASPGFALSALATAGLLVLAPPWRAALARRLPGWLADALAVPAAAQVACGPVVVALAGEVGLLTVPANLLVGPVIAPITVLGVVAALLAPVSLPLAQLVAWVAYLPTAWLVAVARTGAQLPGAAVPWPDGMRGALLLLAVTVCALLLLARPPTRRPALAAVAAAAVTWGVLSRALPAWPPPGWVLVMCDVGQGDALVVAAGDGQALVVDAGPDPEAVDGCLRRLGVRRVPLVVVSHPHADHVDGLPGVLGGRAVGAVQMGVEDDPPAQAAKVQRWAAEYAVPVVRGAAGEVRQVGDVRWRVLAPLRTYRDTRSDPNNASLVLLLEVRGLRVLLSGDIEPEAQADLLASGEDLRADVLKTPHHGSDHQDPQFLAAVGARVALTSVGADNTYGHPAPETLAQLAAAGASSYRTDQDGDVAVTVRDGVLRVATSR